MYCTAAVEALCEALFAAALPQAQAQDPGDATLTVSHLQLALRSHAALAALLRRVPGVGLALGFFLDGATSRALYERRLLASGDAPHLRRRRPASPTGVGDEDEDEIERHARARREWARRADDPFADEDLAAVLKGVHPAFSLSYNATALLRALVRELLNAACDQLPLDEDAQRPVAAADVADALGRALGPEDDGDGGDLLRFMARTASACVARFAAGDAAAARSPAAALADVRFRVVHAATSASAAALLSPPLGLCLPSVPASTPFALLLPRMCRRGRVADDRGAWMVVYRGREVDARATPGTLELPIGSFPAADGSLPSADDALVRLTLAATNAPFVFLVLRKWWDDARRSEARRGRLASQRPQDARVRLLVAASESRVRQSLRRSRSRSRSRSPSPSAELRGPSAELRIPVAQAAPAKRSHPKRSHSRSAVTLAVTSPASSQLTSSLPTSLSVAQLPCDTNMDNDSLSDLLQPHGKITRRPHQSADEAAGLAVALADALRTAAREAEAAAARMGDPRPLAAARDEWTVRVHALDALVARTQAARAAAAQILARVEFADADSRP